ncbi:MAG: SMP-30/gluconolactonase/LRE family protein [candidate division WOR-3 bacterium]|nr:SMP-30/gluconolactonase/LRE family protein [candidate division WOR-3 bacterium]
MSINVLNLIIFSITISSANGAFIGDISYSGDTELSTTSFKLYDRDGNMLYHIINPDAITFFISNSGTVFATNEQNLYFYKLNGEIKILKELHYPNGFGFSPDNKIFFASDRDGLYAYSTSGNLVYQFNPGRLFTSTEKADHVAVVSNDTVFFYEKGKLKSVSVLQNPFVRKIQFVKKNLIEIELPDTIIYLEFTPRTKED